MTGATPELRLRGFGARHVLNLVALVVALGGLGLLLRALGRAEMARLVHAVDGCFVVVLGLAAAQVACDVGAIHVFMRPEARTVSYARVLAAQLSGVAVNLVTPGGKLGEATKMTLLASHAPRNRVISSVLLFNLG